MNRRWEQDTEFDVALLEEKNGVQMADAYQIQEKGTTEQLEEKLGVSSREEEGKKLPKERVEPRGNEKTAYQAQKHRVKGSSYKDNMKRKDKSSGRKKTMKDAAKKELKSIFAKQLLEEQAQEEQERAIENFGNTLAVNFLKKSGYLGLQVMIKALVSFLGLLFSMLIGLVTTIVFAIPTIICIVTIVCVLLATSLISGIFVSSKDAAQDNFAVNRIIEYQESLINEAKAYNGKWHWGYNIEEVIIRYSGISNISSNSDDILLAYMTEATGEKIMETDNIAPLMNVNTLNEKKAMNSALKDMLYISNVSYEKCSEEILVVVTPTPASSSEEEPPVQEEQTITITRYYYKATVTISGISAKTWVQRNADAQELSMYSLLENIFNSFGYKSLEGDAVCQKYLSASLK